MKTQHLLAGGFCIMAFMAGVCADTNLGSQIPSVGQVTEALKKPANPDADNGEGDIKTCADNDIKCKHRMIEMSPAIAKEKHTVKRKLKSAAKQELAKENALSMNILFAYNSAELTEMAKKQLEPIGKALVSNELHTLAFVIEGHTDAVGGASYNKTLSAQRADAVKQFLVDNFQIPASRIQAVGKGKSDLLDPKRPDSEVNRRVRIVTQ